MPFFQHFFPLSFSLHSLSQKKEKTIFLPSSSFSALPLQALPPLYVSKREREASSTLSPPLLIAHFFFVSHLSFSLLLCRLPCCFAIAPIVGLRFFFFFCYCASITYTTTKKKKKQSLDILIHASRETSGRKKKKDISLCACVIRQAVSQSAPALTLPLPLLEAPYLCFLFF